MDLLPTKDELVPITDDRDVFFECPFNKDWDKLDFKSKLQIACDIVRQTMIYDENKEEYEQLRGDSYTASNITIDYLKSLSLGTNYRCAFALKKPYETEDAYTTHIVTLVDDEEGNTFFLDSTPLIGYKCGKVGQIKEKYYEDYIIIEGELKRIYEELRKVKIDIINNNFNVKRINEVLNESKKYSALHGTLYELNQMLRLKGFIFDDGIKYQYGIDRNKLIQELKKWKEELNDLIITDVDLNRQLELSQLINSETLHSEPKIIINGKCYNISELTPRFFSDNNFTTIMVKASAYIFGWEEEVKSRMLNGATHYGDYDPKFYLKSSQGLEKMKFFHPHGYKYIREMTGPSEIIMVRQDAKDLYKNKKTIRYDLVNRVNDKEVMWFDNKSIIWNPACLNFAHTADNYSESSMNYAIGYPEYQVMSRFMYPNLKLERR